MLDFRECAKCGAVYTLNDPHDHCEDCGVGYYLRDDHDCRKRDSPPSE